MIVTFYSYKGGAGRTLALANVAAVLADDGFDVVVSDWDLEAPSLERFLLPPNRKSSTAKARGLVSSRGLVDLIGEYKAKLSERDSDELVNLLSGDGPPPESLQPEMVERLMKTIGVTQPHTLLKSAPFPRGGEGFGSIRILTAGRRGTDREAAGDAESSQVTDDYSRAVQRLDWTELYRDWAGEALVEYIRRDLQDQADFVLIDSRTGLTELGGVCTRQLADLVVFVTTPAGSSMQGTLRLCKRLTTAHRSGNPRPLLLPIRARIDTTEGSALHKFREDFDAKFAPFLPDEVARKDRFFRRTEVPYKGAQSFSEQIAYDERSKPNDQDLDQAYRSIAGYLVRIGQRRGWVRTPTPARGRLGGEDTEPGYVAAARRVRSVYVAYEHRIENRARTLAAALRSENVRVAPLRSEVALGGPNTLGGTARAGGTVILIDPETDKNWLWSEVDLAVRRAGREPDFTIVPVLLDDARLPPRLQNVMRLAWPAADDPNSFRELAQNLSACSSPARWAAPRDKHPLPGERPFAESGAAFFFGRDAEVGRVLSDWAGQLASGGSRWLRVTGASGVGKSSFVAAGLVPAIRRGELTGEAATLEIVLLSRPVSATGSEVHRDVVRLEERLNRSRSDRPLLVVIDQLEALCLLAESETPREPLDRLDAQLSEAVGSTEGPVHLITVERADFDVARLRRALPQLFDRGEHNATRFVLEGFDAHTVEELIVRPAEVYGAMVDRALSATLRIESRRLASDPVLVSRTLRMVWPERGENAHELSFEAYERLGGVLGVASRMGSQLWSSLSPADQDMAKCLLLAFVRVRRGANIQTRRLSWEDVDLAVGSAGRDLAYRLSGGTTSDDRPLGLRILTANADGIRLIHQELPRRWVEMRSWIDRHTDDLERRTALEDLAIEWDQRERAAHLLASAGQLATMGNAAPVLKLVQSYLQASRRQRKHVVVRQHFLRWLAMTAAVLVVVASWFIVDARRELEKSQEQAYNLNLMAADIGIFELVLAPFDWNAERLAAEPVPPEQLEGLDWRLYRTSGSGSPEVGAPIPSSFVDAGSAEALSPGKRLQRVEAPGGPAFIEIHGRGREGKQCGSTWLPIRLPGFSDREAPRPPRLVINVPTCRASEAGMVRVPAGKFQYRGPSDPPAEQFFDDGVEINLPAFYVDRTEVTNAAYRMLEPMSDFTGLRKPDYPGPGLAPVLDGAGDPVKPVVNLDSYTARAFCRFMGKDLPTNPQWEKAARGGLFLDEAAKIPNPNPTRNYPWGGPHDRSLANLSGVVGIDGFVGAAPVGSFPDGASPYGVLDMSGNVIEWTLTWAEVNSAMRLLRGGSWATKPDKDHHSISYDFHRHRLLFAYDIGFRCVFPPNPEQNDSLHRVRNDRRGGSD